MPDTNTLDTLKAEAASKMKETVAALEKRETELSEELSKVRAERKDMAKLVEKLTDTAPRRRRGRPRKSETEAASETAAA